MELRFLKEIEPKYNWRGKRIPGEYKQVGGAMLQYRRKPGDEWEYVESHTEIYS
jgi:hypothetical protein